MILIDSKNPLIKWTGLVDIATNSMDRHEENTCTYFINFCRYLTFFAIKTIIFEIKFC